VFATPVLLLIQNLRSRSWSLERVNIRLIPALVRGCSATLVYANSLVGTSVFRSVALVPSDWVCVQNGVQAGAVKLCFLCSAGSVLRCLFGAQSLVFDQVT
jgi:hypothetical protein